MKKLKIILIRHGEVSSNTKDVVLGSAEMEALNETGVTQAQALAHHLAERGTKASEIHCSKFRRAFQTAKIIAKGLGLNEESQVICVEELRERNYGDWEGQQIDTIKMEGMRLGTHPALLTPPNGESFQDAFRRFKDYLESLLGTEKFQHVAEEDRKEVLVVSHCAVIHSFIHGLYLETKESAAPPLNQSCILQQIPNTSFTTFTMDFNKGHVDYSFEQLFSTQHLQNS